MGYTWETRIRYSEIGEDRKLTLHGLLNYFQDCTTFHSHQVGRGMDVLDQDRHIWVLSSWQVAVSRYPELAEEVTVSTWPYDFRGFSGSRNFEMKTKRGERLAYANSLWTFLDLRTGKPCRILPEELQAYPMEPRLEMDYAPRKILMPDERRTMEPFTVKKHHLDTNHHVNNGQYVRIAQDYLPEKFPVRQMRAEYKRQAVLGDVVVPVAAYEQGRMTVALCDQESSPYAIVEFC